MERLMEHTGRYVDSQSTMDGKRTHGSVGVHKVMDHEKHRPPAGEAVGGISNLGGAERSSSSVRCHHHIAGLSEGQGHPQPGTHTHTHTQPRLYNSETS